MLTFYSTERGGNKRVIRMISVRRCETIAGAMMDLEVEIAHLSRMAEIPANLLDSNIVDVRGDRPT